MLQKEKKKKKRFPSQFQKVIAESLELHLSLQASVSLVNVEAHDNTVRERFYKYRVFGRVSRRMSLISKNNMFAWLRCTKLPSNTLQD